MPDDPRPDAELLAAFARADAGAFDAFYHRHKGWAMAVALRFTRSEPEALDALQEAFLYIARKRPLLDEGRSARALLYPAIKHSALAILRKRRRPADSAAAAALAADPPARPQPPASIDSASREQLALALAALPEPQRECLLMRFVDEMPLADIAAALAVPTGTVKSRIHNALNTLRQDPRARRFFGVD